jgi:histidine triad (HIT) family protein
MRACRARVYGELRGELGKWEAEGRWAPTLGAGLRDAAPATVFDQILDGSIPAAVVYEDDGCLAFKDVHPVAPQHVLLIPKRRNGLTRLKHATADHLMSKVGAVAFGRGARRLPRRGQRCQTTASKTDREQGWMCLGGIRGARGRPAAVLHFAVAPSPQLQTVFHLHLHIIGGRELAWPPG